MNREEKLKASFSKDAYDIDKSRGFELTTIDAYHIIERLNDVFGLCGTGWRLDVKEWRTTDKEIICIAELWYDLNITRESDNPKSVSCVGGKRIIKDNLTDAYKSAMTNAICKGASFLGVGLDVYKGEFENGKSKPNPKGNPSPENPSTEPSQKQIDMIDKILKSHLLPDFEHYRLQKFINKGISKETVHNYIEWWIGEKSLEHKKRQDMEKADKKNETETLKKHLGKREQELAQKFPGDYKEFLETISK